MVGMEDTPEETAHRAAAPDIASPNTAMTSTPQRSQTQNLVEKVPRYKEFRGIQDRNAHLAPKLAPAKEAPELTAGPSARTSH